MRELKLFKDGDVVEMRIKELEIVRNMMVYG